jgi:hypothetical protein
MSKAQIPSTEPKTANTNIISAGISDTLLFPMELKGGGVDASRKNVPIYVVQKTTEYSQKAKPSLIIKRTSLVSAQNADIIRKFFLPFIKTEFDLKALNSLVKNKNNNNYLLLPFRINAQQQIEELLEYDVKWTISAREETAARGASSFTNSSVLAQGNWYKIGVVGSGLHRMGRSFFQNMGIDVVNIDPRTIQVYGNGGKMLPELNSASRLDDLKENAIKVIGEEDGVFDVNDYVVFYGEGVDEWRYSGNNTSLKYAVTKNIYSYTDRILYCLV